MRLRRLGVNEAELAVAAVRVFKARTVTTAEIQSFLASPTHYVLVVDDAEVPVGFLLAYRLERIDRPSAKMFIYEVDVAATHRRRGIGSSMIAMIRELANRERMMNAFVFTSHSNEGAVAFYERTGGRIVNGDDLMFEYVDD